MKKYLGLILIAALSSTAFAKRAPKIKVRIANSLTRVHVSGYDLKRYIWPTNSMREFSGEKTIQLNCKSKKKINRKKPIRLASINSHTGLLNWEKDRYQGALHIQTSEKFNGCDIVNELSLEDYLSTLLPKEMSPTWPLEALKAQAVAARSYAYYKIITNQTSRSKGFKTNYDIENSETHQVSGTYFDATRKTKLATKKTRGLILTLKSGKKTPIFFHSKCGGKTLRPDQVWRNKVEGYRSVSDPFCHKHGMKNWSRSFTKKKFAYYVNKVLKKFSPESYPLNKSSIKLLNDSKSSSRIKLYSDSHLKILKKSRLRGVAGRKTLPSNYYNIAEKKGQIVVSGAGYGHGVGMCQFGAKELALQGLNYKQILVHYFPELKLTKIY